MHIDLIAAETALKELRNELGLSNQACCIGIELWNHSDGSRPLTIRISLFDNSGQWQQSVGATCGLALEALKIAFKAKSFDPGSEPISVEVNEQEAS